MSNINVSSLQKNHSFKMSSDGDNNLSKYIGVYRKLLSLNKKNNLASNLKYIQELLSFGEKIFSSSSVAEVFLYFCLKGAATAWILQTELNIPEATVYRVLKRLRALGIIVPALKVSKIKGSKGGPRPTVWALTDTSTIEISKALKLHFRTLSPKYKVAEEIAQTIMDEYINKRERNEISYREILIHIKELFIPFNKPDIADLTARYLHEKGIKVWR